MNEERMKILKMVEDGKITADEASKLLGALEEGAGPAGIASPARWLRIRVQELDGGRPKVNVNLPLQLVQLAFKFIPQGVLDSSSTPIDLESVLASIKEGARGAIVDVQDTEENVHVQIFVE